MDKLGKLTFRFATSEDQSLIEDFCKSQSYSNNITLKKMKWFYCLEEGAWTIALENNKIVSLAGIHPLSKVDKNAYRCLFRGAQLPGYTLGVGRDIFKTGIQLSYLLPLQIQWALKQNQDAKLYISTNINDDGAKSQRMNNVIMPLMAKRGIWKLVDTLELFDVKQNLWLLDVDRYMEERNLSLGNDNYILQKL